MEPHCAQDGELTSTKLLRPPGFEPKKRSSGNQQKEANDWLSNPGPRPPGFVPRSEPSSKAPHATLSHDSESHLLEEKEQRVQELQERLTQLKRLISRGCNVEGAIAEDEYNAEDLRLSKVQIRVRVNMICAELLLLEQEIKQLQTNSTALNHTTAGASLHHEYAQVCLGRLSEASPVSVEDVRWSGNGETLHIGRIEQHTTNRPLEDLRRDMDKQMVLQVVNRLSMEDLRRDSASPLGERCMDMRDRLEGMEHDGRKPSNCEIAMGIGIYSFLQDQDFLPANYWGDDDDQGEANQETLSSTDFLLPEPALVEGGRPQKWVKTPQSSKSGAPRPQRRTVIKAEDLM